MKRQLTSLLLASLLTSQAFAANTTTTIAQVTKSVTVADAVNYTITSATPFAEGATVNLVNTDHAVLIIQNIKPSLVLSNGWLDYVLINGEKAVDGENCQVRMYAHGTIVFPYSKNIKPLTVYAEQNCQGESSNAFGLENTGGYMNTLSASKLNNRIRSFTLKRGYMVTFAVGTGGWGYSRCFIAHDEDLVINELPVVLDERISSYRVFKWVYAQKKGLASNGSREDNSKLNTSWCYDWAQGNASLLPDQEWVPNHIYEDYPSIPTIGGVTGSCHSKNNNEPANSSDDHPQSVETVLNNWQNIMRTGMRLCSPATHDGGWGWHNDFMNAIDARGWRCDLVDFHGYWNSGSWGSLDWYIDTYAHGRPVWFSEWVWGSSWGNQGIFAECPDGRDSYSKANQQKCYDGTKPILDRLNANERVERYAYWNGEANCSKILLNGELSILGKYYADMKSGIGYKKSREFIPKDPPTSEPTDFTASLNRKTGIVALTWTDPLGDLMNSITVQCLLPGETTWTDIRSITPRDVNSRDGVTYSINDTISEPGKYSYRIKSVAYNKRSVISETQSVAISSQYTVGDFNCGSSDVPTAIDMTSTTTINATAITVSLEGLSASPCAFLGLPSYNNTTVGVTSFLNSAGTSTLKFGAMPWTTGFTGSYTKSETMDYLAVPEGTYLYGDKQVVVGKVSSVSNTDVDVTFATPFPDGDSVVVICQPYMTNLKYGTVTRVSNVTNTGFKVRHVGQKDQAVTKKTIYYIAASKGQAKLDDGYLLSAGTGNKAVGGRSSSVTFMFDSYTTDESGALRHDTLQLYQPTILCGPQTDRLPEVASTFRIKDKNKVNVTAADGSTYSAVRGLSVIRQIDASAGYTGTNSSSANGDIMGWIIISTDPEYVPSAVQKAKAQSVTTQRAIYTIDGKRIGDGHMKRGIYIVKEGNDARKVVIE